MQKNISVMIVDDVDETRELIKVFLSFSNKFDVVCEAANGVEAVKNAKKYNPDVILMDINMPEMDGLQASEKISMMIPEIIIILLSVQDEKEYFKKAMNCGVRDFIAKPFDTETITNTILNAVDRDQRKSKLKSTGVKEIVTEHKGCEVITVFSTKGGVGKTTVAVNTAIGLAQKTGKRVAVMDLDLQFGDVGLMLDIESTRTISNIVEDISTITPDKIEEYMIEYMPGVRVITAPIKPEQADYIASNHIEKIIEMLKKNHDYLIIDTRASFDEITITALDKADQVIMVSTKDMLSLKDVKLGMNVMKSLNYADNKIMVILNRIVGKFGISVKDVENIFEKKVNIVIPEDQKTVLISANKGIPIMIHDKKSKVCKEIQRLSEIISRNIA